MLSVCLENTTKIFGTEMLPQLEIHTTEDDIKYVLFSQSEVISDSIRSTGWWNAYVHEIAEKILEKTISNDSESTGVVLDIGAGIGTFTVPLALKFQQLKFVSFEPLKVIFWQLCSNILLNNLYNVRTHEKYISDMCYERLYRDIDYASSSNHGSMSLDEYTNEIRGIDVANNEPHVYTSLKIDDIGYKKLVLIKISAAGMEDKVLIGAKETIKRCMNPPIILELWSESFYEQKQTECLNLLKELGYESVHRVGNHVFAYRSEEEYLIYNSDMKSIGVFGGFNVIEHPVHITDAVEHQIPHAEENK